MGSKTYKLQSKKKRANKSWPIHQEIRKGEEKCKLAYNLTVKSILPVIIVTLPGLRSAFETEGLSGLKRISPTLLRVVDCWIGSPKSHSVLLQFGEVAKLKSTFFKGLQGEGAGCESGCARKLRLRKVHTKMMHLVDGGEAEATCLLLVDRTQVWAGASTGHSQSVLLCLVTNSARWEVRGGSAALASWSPYSNLESIIQRRPPISTPSAAPSFQ